MRAKSCEEKYLGPVAVSFSEMYLVETWYKFDMHNYLLYNSDWNTSVSQIYMYNLYNIHNHNQIVLVRKDKEETFPKECSWYCWRFQKTTIGKGWV